MDTREGLSLITLLLVINSLFSGILVSGQKPAKQGKGDAAPAPPPTGKQATGKQATGDAAASANSDDALTNFLEVAGKKYVVSTKGGVTKDQAFSLCQNYKKDQGELWGLLGFEDYDLNSSPRKEITEKLQTTDYKCVWANYRDVKQGSAKVLVFDSLKGRQMMPWNMLNKTKGPGGVKKAKPAKAPKSTTKPEEKPEPANGTVGQDAKKKGKRGAVFHQMYKRQVSLAEGIKLIALTVKETIFPWIDKVPKEAPDCENEWVTADFECDPMVCTINRDGSKCNFTQHECKLTAHPKCQIIRPANQSDCTGGCGVCTIDSLTCYTRTQKCIVEKRECTVTEPKCEVETGDCVMTRPECVTWSEPCSLKQTTESDCVADEPCEKATEENFCSLIEDKTCDTKNGTQKCAKIFNCTLNPLCIKPILCRPSVIKCPAPKTFCPPPIVQCPAPKVTCGKPIITCKEPKIQCPAPEVICTQPTVKCGAPIVKCAQVLATCNSPDVACQPPNLSCPPPEISCEDPVPCPTDDDPKRPCVAPKCPPSICQCVALEKSQNYGFHPCSCDEKCVPICEKFK